MDDILIHHGILGQKWGVRRFQNEDGSLTKAGKERYGVGGDSTRVFDKRNEYKDTYNKVLENLRSGYKDFMSKMGR